MRPTGVSNDGDGRVSSLSAAAVNGPGTTSTRRSSCGIAVTDAPHNYNRVWDGDLAPMANVGDGVDQHRQTADQREGYGQPDVRPAKPSHRIQIVDFVQPALVL